MVMRRLLMQIDQLVYDVGHSASDRLLTREMEETVLDQQRSDTPDP
jgi:hypothetical protein